MKKNLYLLLTLIISLSLAGIFFLQIHWMRDAYSMQDEQFTNKVSITLKSVINSIFDSGALERPDSISCRRCDSETSSIISRIRPVMIDSIFRYEFRGMGITKNYTWAVFNPYTQQVYAGTLQDTAQFMAHNYNQSLYCIYRHHDLVLGVHFPNENKFQMQQKLPWILLNLVFLGMIIGAFVYTIRNLIKQKRISDIKSDFVNNMTHEFKTPISTVSLASEILLKPEIQQSPDKIKRYASIIYNENLRLKNQVDKVLQLALFEKGFVQIHPVSFDAHEAITQVSSGFELSVKEKSGTYTMQLDAAEHTIEADELHFKNIISTLLDNALKYTKNSPVIQLTTLNRNNKLVVQVKDNGIGIDPLNQKFIFDQLYRISTGDKHDIKGFGIGLYYVKQMTLLHHGNISVKSEPNKGSIFELELPLKQTE